MEGRRTRPCYIEIKEKWPGKWKGEKERGQVWLTKVTRTKVFTGEVRGKHSSREAEKKRN